MDPLKVTRAGGALLRGLDKISGTASDLQLAVGQAVDFGRLKTKFPYITMMPQTSFLQFVTREASRYPPRQLPDGAQVTRFAPSRTLSFHELAVCAHYGGFDLVEQTEEVGLRFDVLITRFFCVREKGVEVL